MDHYVMDYETISDCFLACFEHYKTDEVHIFTIGLLRNDLTQFLEFLHHNILHNEWHISFNGLAFDAQLTQFIWYNRARLRRMTGVTAASIIYVESQAIINRSKNREFQKYWEGSLIIKQIDLFKLNHWDNPAKSSSLKWIQCSMDWHNVQNMPIHHTASITTWDQLKQIALYCRNDVSSTKAIMNKNAKEIELRGILTNTYKIPLYSASEPKLSKELFLHFLSLKTGTPKHELKKLRTFRTHIYVKDIILPYTRFDVQTFDDLLWKFKALVINPDMTKDGFKFSVNYRGVKTDFGLGGVHGAKRGIYESDETMTIMTSDVVSYYPRLAMVNKWSPAQLDAEVFTEQYEWFFTERRKISKKDIRNYVYKIILNATFGLSNDKNCFLYDPEFCMRITINGQLSLMMLYTMLVEGVPGAVPIMQNTDGIEIMIPSRHKQLYLDICTEWEKITQLNLEHEEYQKLIVPDVNNYIGVYKDQEVTKDEWFTNQKDFPDNLYKRKAGKYYMAKTKCKGRFEFRDRPLHKNKSFDVIAKALFYYFVHGLEPKKYVMGNANIFDYCGQVKVNKSWEFIHIFVEKSILHKDKLQETLRYYIINTGGKVVKHNLTDNRQIQVEAGKWMQAIFNQYVEKPFEEYDINYKYYMDKIEKEINALQPVSSNQIEMQF